MKKLFFSPVDFPYGISFQKLLLLFSLGLHSITSHHNIWINLLRHFEDLKQNEILRPDHRHIIVNLRVSHLVYLLGQCFVCSAKKVLQLGIY